MEGNVPKHHIKGEVCTTRPAYREGRVPKAVKVYTVNNESQYILIQNVPSVGAKEELFKLCSSFGPLDDHQILDEYPTEDKYTEVHLIKYKRITSARFAKRKLDDRSFFGGALHVCYAPEYESVQETEKSFRKDKELLLERLESFGEIFHQDMAGTENGETERQFHRTYQRKHYTSKIQSQSEMGSSSIATTLEENTPATSTNVLPQYENESHVECAHAIDSSDPSKLHQDSFSTSENIHEKQTGFVSSSDSHKNFGDVPPISFNIPPPPKPDPKGHFHRKTKYEFARVRSHHASLPARFMETDSTHGKTGDQDQNFVAPTCNVEASGTAKNIPVKSSDSRDDSPVVREYKTSKPTLKFVPRQAVKRNAEDAGHSQQDSENAVIKKNAFLLGAVQGPRDVPSKRAQKPKLNPGVEDSYRKTISDIRSKISKVISDNVKPH